MQWQQRYTDPGRSRGGYAPRYGSPPPRGGSGSYAVKPPYPTARQPPAPQRRPSPYRGSPPPRRMPPQTQSTAHPPAPYQNGAIQQQNRPITNRPLSRIIDNCFLYSQKTRKLNDIYQRYPRLNCSSDFSELVCHSISDKPLSIPLNVTIPFVSDPDLTLPVPEAETTADTEDKHFARVMILSMAKEETQTEDDDKKKTKLPLNKTIKFLVAKKANGGLMSIGGQWSPNKDGGNPNEDKTLVKTATRHCKEMCGIDLSTCKQWIKFMEVKYTRPNGAHDRTVIFIPDVWNHLNASDVKVYKQVQRQEIDGEEEVEVEVEVDAEGKIIDGTEVERKEGEEKKTKKIRKKVPSKKSVETVVLRSMDLSLFGILEYDLQDKQEETAELSLFAELFDEMLSSQFAEKILSILKVKKQEADVAASESKRKREAEQAERQAKFNAEREEREAKRRKLEDEREKELERQKKADEEEKYLTEEQIRERRAKEAAERKAKLEAEALKKQEEEKLRKQAEEEKKKTEEEQRKKKEEEERLKPTRTVKVTTTNVDNEALSYFQWFDKPVSSQGTQSGQLKKERLEAILHGLGYLCTREVDELLAAVGLGKEKIQGSLYYKPLVTTTIIETKEVPKEEPKPEPTMEETKENNAVDGDTEMSPAITTEATDKKEE